MLFEEPNILKYFNKETNTYENKDDDEFWKNLIFKKFQWIKELVERQVLKSKIENEITPEILANYCDDQNIEYNEHLLETT